VSPEKLLENNYTITLWAKYLFFTIHP